MFPQTIARPDEDGTQDITVLPRETGALVQLRGCGKQYSRERLCQRAENNVGNPNKKGKEFTAKRIHGRNIFVEEPVTKLYHLASIVITPHQARVAGCQ